MTIRCVGIEYVTMEAYRWIEFEIGDRASIDQSATVFKVLFKEADLLKGNDSLTNVRQCLRCKFNSVGDCIEVKNETSLPAQLGWFLPIPLEESSQMPNQTIESWAGDIECQVTKGIYLEKTRWWTGKREYTVYSHEKSPFGTVYFTCYSDYPAAAEYVGGKIILKLQATGTDAESAFYNHQK